MPICTNCTHPTPYLYTVYNSEDNLRLEHCDACHAFADPYVEHDILTLWIDLVLLKRDVYRHLLFNRGAGARRLTATVSDTSGTVDNPQTELEERREKRRWIQILQLGSALVAVDAFIRWSHLSPRFTFGTNTHHEPTIAGVPSWNHDALESYFRILVGCLIETVGFHLGVTLASFIVLHTLDWIRALSPSKLNKFSGIRLQFRYSQIPLTILYSSLNKLFLLLLLTIWRPQTPGPGMPSSSTGNESVLHNPRPLPREYDASTLFTNPWILHALTILDDDKLDREWIVRNILGGMATGFGLRVVLDCHPVFTTMIILTGWAVKTALAHLVSGWVGAGIDSGGQGAEMVAQEMWLAYSIP